MLNTSKYLHSNIEDATLPPQAAPRALITHRAAHRHATASPAASAHHARQRRAIIINCLPVCIIPFINPLKSLLINLIINPLTQNHAGRQHRR